MKVLPRLAVALAAITVVSGCGSDSGSSASPTVDWANDVCGAITTWTDAVESAADQVADGGLSRDELQQSVDSVTKATRTLGDDLSAAGEPETPSGTQAKRTMENLDDRLSTGADTIQNASDDASGVNGFLTAVSTVSGTLASMGRDVTAAVDELQSLDPGGDLEQAIDRASSCDSLTSA